MPKVKELESECFSLLACQPASLLASLKLVTRNELTYAELF